MLKTVEIKQPIRGTMKERGEVMKGYQIKITLKDTSPLIWRRILIPAEFSFELLHDTIQVLFGWQDCHTYDFKIPKKKIKVVQSVNSDMLVFEKYKIITCDNNLSKYLEEGLSLLYTYDYGDMWEHTIKVEKEVDMNDDFPILLKWKGNNLAEDCGSQEHFEYLQEIEKDQKHPEHEAVKDWLYHQHIPFYEEFVKDMLRSINTYAYDEPILSDDISQQLDHALMALQNELYTFDMEGISLLILDTQDKRKVFAISDQEDSINIQIYDNETDFLRGVENVSDTMVYNLYANAYSIIMLDEPLPDFTHWTTKDSCCMVKKMRTGYLPIDVNDEEALEIILDINHVLSMLTSCKHKKLTSMHDGHMMLGSWKKDGTLDITYPSIQFVGEMTTIHLTKQQCSALLQTKRYDKSVTIDLVTQPAESYYINHEMDVLFVLENEDFEISQPLYRMSLKTFEDMNEEVLSLLCSFIEEHGRMKSIRVNNDNMHLMLEGICDDLDITLISDNFVTNAQEEIQNDTLEEDLEMLENLSLMDEQEFGNFISQMSEDELGDFDSLMQQLMNKYVEEDDDSFPTKKKHFDA